MNYILIAVAIIWAICGFLSFGLQFAYYQRAYPTLAKEYRSNDLLFCFLTSLFGPIALVSNLLFINFVSNYGYQGFKWK